MTADDDNREILADVDAEVLEAGASTAVAGVGHLDKLARLTVIWIFEFENRGTAMLSRVTVNPFSSLSSLLVKLASW